MIDPVDFKLELQEIAAESIGWIPLEEGVYLHVSDENATEVLVVGVPQAGGGGVVGYLISPAWKAWSLAVAGVFC